MNSVALNLDWLHTGESGATVVAFTDAGIKTRADLRRDVAALLPTLQAHPAREWIWWEADSYRFLTGALALMAAGKVLLLPPNTTPATLQALHTTGAVMLDDILSPTGEPGTALPLTLPPQAPIVLFTSGSTGTPKRIERQLVQLLQEVQTLQQLFGGRPQTQGRTVLATVSHQHIYGLLFKLLWPLASGRAFLSRQCEYPEQVVQALAQHDNAVVISSPALLKRWPAELQLNAGCVFSSGGLLPANARHQLAALCTTDLIEVLGSSETGGIAWRDSARESWRPMPDVEFRIATNDALEVRTAHACHPEWMATGDTAQVHADGFHLGARQDRLIKLEEKRISLDAVEAALRSLANVQDAHVLLTSRQTRQEISAVVVPSTSGRVLMDTEGKTAFSRQLRAALRVQLEPLALPRRWRFLDALPMNAQGKLDKTSMETLFMEAPFAASPVLPEVLHLETTGDELRIDARVPPSLRYFDGHFPQAPVVAGVVQIAWVEHFARLHLGLTGSFCKMEQLKFQQLLRPAAAFTLSIDYQRDKSRLVFRISDAGHVYSSGRLVYLTEAT